MKTVIFCVNYNSYKELKNYMYSIEGAFYRNEKVRNMEDSVTVIIIDNSQEYQEYKYQGPIDVQCFHTNENLGYFGGVRYGIRSSKLNLIEYDFIIISNVDLILSEDFFLQLYNERYDENIGCIAPSIISKYEKVNRNPKVLTRYSKRKLEILRAMNKYPILMQIYSRYFHASSRSKVESQTLADMDIYAAHGSFMIFTNKSAAFLQNMKFLSFMFCEELFIAEELRNMGLRTVYKPQIKVVDIDHVSTSKMKSDFYYKCNYESLNMILGEYYK